MDTDEGGGTRELILEFAEELIAKQGIEGFKLKDIAIHLGIQPPSIFSHFEGRDAIAREVRTRVYRKVGDSMHDPKSPEPTHIVKQWARNLTAHLYANPAHSRILLYELAMTRHDDPEVSRPLRIYTHNVVARIGRVLRRGQRSGQFRKVRPDAFLALFLGGILSNLAWDGWDEEGNPLERPPLSRVKREAEDLVLGLLQRR